MVRLSGAGRGTVPNGMQAMAGAAGCVVTGKLGIDAAGVVVRLETEGVTGIICAASTMLARRKAATENMTALQVISSNRRSKRAVTPSRKSGYHNFAVPIRLGWYNESTPVLLYKDILYQKID